VALVNGIPPEDLINTSLPHLCRQLKVIVQEKKGLSFPLPYSQSRRTNILQESETSKYLSLIGGMWTTDDGGDPDTELSALIRTAMYVY
jgi:hypothetical protein